jgi:Fe2+ transport system protein FeoA
MVTRMTAERNTSTMVKQNMVIRMMLPPQRLKRLMGMGLLRQILKIRRTLPVKLMIMNTAIMDTIIKHLFLGMVLLLAACGQGDTGQAAHGNDHSGQQDDHGDEPALVYTHYTEQTELFVEFPPLVAGQSSVFAAHLTRLADFQPLNTGTLDVELQQDGKMAARFRVKEPARSGIFTPNVVPREAGTFELIIAVESGDVRAIHRLGLVTVFADSASVSVPEMDAGGEITYLKEQQWTSPFATLVIGERPLRPSVAGTATVFAGESTDRRRLYIRVPEHEAGELRQVSGAWFRQGDNIEILDVGRGMRLVQVGGAIDPVSRTVPVVIEYPADRGPALIGSSLTAHVYTQPAKPRLAIPATALIDDGGRPVIYVQTGGESFTRRAVELGIQDGSWIEVLSGAQAGERVVSIGAYYVKLASAGGDEVGHGHAH